MTPSDPTHLRRGPVTRARVAALIVRLSMLGAIIVATASQAVADGSLTVLPTPTWGELHSMSDDGAVVAGPYSLIEGGVEQSRAFLGGDSILDVSADGGTLISYDEYGVGGSVWDLSTKTRTIREPSWTSTVDVSANGSTTVWLDDGYNGPFPTLRREGAGTVTEIPRPAGLPYEDPYYEADGLTNVQYQGLSNDAEVIYASVDSKPMVWTAGSGSVLLSADLRTRGASSGGDASPDGQHIAFSAYEAAGAPGDQLFLSLSGAAPVAIDAATSVTVVEVADGATRILGVRDGVAGVWNASGQFQDIPLILSAAGIDLGSFDQDVRALDISSDGGLIMGSSSDGASTQYWIADIGVVPEPGTALLVGIGLLGMARRVNRRT